MGRMTEDTRAPNATVMALSDADRDILAALAADERELIERAIRHDPKLTVEKAVKALRLFGI